MYTESFGKRFWRMVYPLGLYILISSLAGFASSLYLVAQGVSELGFSALNDPEQLLNQAVEKMPDTLFWATLISAAVTLPFLLLFYHWDMKREQKLGTKKIYEKVPAPYFGIVILLGIAACFAGNNLITMSGLMNSTSGYEEVAEVLYGGRLAVELLGIGILVPVVEELIFRGLAYKRMREYASPLMAGITTSMLFAVFHGNLVQGVYAFLLGALLCYVYEKYHSFWAPVLLHAAANVISVLASETSLFDFLYSGRGIFFAFTLIVCVLVVVFVYLTERLVVSNQLNQKAE